MHHNQKSWRENTPEDLRDRNRFIALFIAFIMMLLLLMALASSAAPLPPMPVKRPAPLFSPKAASAPKYVPMVKASFTPASVPMAPIFLTYQKDINVLHCNTNDAHCMLYDITNLSAVQRAGFGLVIEFADTVTESQWAFAANSSAWTEDRTVEMQWMHTSDQRLVSRFFRAREVPGPTAARAAVVAANALTVNPAIPGLRAWIVPKRK